MSSLYVGKLSSHVRHKELENTFRRFGRCYLELKDGYGFVIYEEFQDAEKALKTLQGTLVCGEQPSIKWAKGRRRLQRNSDRGGLGRRGSWEKRQSEAGRRWRSKKIKRGLNNDGEVKSFDEVKDGSTAHDMGEDRATISGQGEEEWDGKLGVDQEVMDVDPLDGGRWDPHMEGSPEDMMAMDEEHPSDHKNKEDRRHDIRDKSQGSLLERHVERSSRGHRNSYDHWKRGRDVGRPQERCHRCGQYGHAKWKCNARPRKGGYDGRRREGRYFIGRGALRGIRGRFKGMIGASRRFSRETGDFGRRHARQHAVEGRRHPYNRVDNESWERTKRRRPRSQSPKGSPSRGRNKQKHKQAGKKSSKKRHRSSSTSAHSAPHGSPNGQSSSSSSSKSGSQSHSVASRSSRSSSRSSSSRSSHSQSSQDHSSRSRLVSASSISRSQSASRPSRKSPSRSPLLHSPRPSHSLGMNGISSSPNTAFKSPVAGSPKEDDDQEVASSAKPSLQSDHGLNGDDDRDETDNDYNSYQSQDMQEEEERRRERRRVWSREVKRQKANNKSDSEEPFLAPAEAKSNGINHEVNGIVSHDTQPSIQLNAGVNESLSGDSAVVVDTKYRMYVAIKTGSTGSHEQVMGGFAMARLWPWEALLYRRFKRGLISTANYERRKAQNEEFTIKDAFVRSSSGWWEEAEEMHTK